MMAVARACAAPNEHRQPPELIHSQQIDRWGALPNGGGLDDEPIGYLGRCSWASAVHKAFSGRYGAKNVIAWIDSNSELFELYAYVIKIIELSDAGWSAEDAMQITDLIVDENAGHSEQDAIAIVRKRKRGN